MWQGRAGDRAPYAEFLTPPTIDSADGSQDFCSTNASRACLSCFKFGAYLSASSYLTSASLVFPSFTRTSPKALSGSAQRGPWRSDGQQLTLRLAMTAASKFLAIRCGPGNHICNGVMQPKGFGAGGGRVSREY